MAWTMCEGCGIPRGFSFPHGFPKEVSPVSFTPHLSSFTRKQFYRRLQEAYPSGSLKLVQRIHALLALTQGQSVCEVADMLALGEQSVRNYRNQYLFKGMASLVYKSPPGRPSKLTKSQRQQLSRSYSRSSPRRRLHLRRLEYADDSGAHLARIQSSIQSALSGDFAQEHGRFLGTLPN